MIFEDVDQDGHFDKRTVFVDNLNLVSGLELGYGGVWVGAAPDLLFIPDRDGDDKPDGPPQVMLDGWAWQDTHETLNSFIWGPDGWLYGCHGVFTHSRVGKPGTPDADRQPINAGIWRYHPTRGEFEVFAHGTSNPWGVDFNERGQAFLTACVIPHLYHVIQGGRYQRQGGAALQPVHVRRHQDDRQAPSLRGRQSARRQRPLGLGRRWPRPRRGDDLSGRRVARQISRSDLHEQHPRRPDQPR